MANSGFAPARVNQDMLEQRDGGGACQVLDVSAQSYSAANCKAPPVAVQEADQNVKEGQGNQKATSEARPVLNGRHKQNLEQVAAGLSSHVHPSQEGEEALTSGWRSPGGCSISPRQETDDEWEDASEAELESLILEDLDRYSREAIDKIVYFGFGRSQAQAAVLQHGSFAGDKNVLNNMVANAMMHMEEEEEGLSKRKGREEGDEDDSQGEEEDAEWRQEELFECFVELQTDALSRAVNLLLQVRPELTRSDALWNLIMADLDVNRACLMPATSRESRSAAAAARAGGKAVTEVAPPQQGSKAGEELQQEPAGEAAPSSIVGLAGPTKGSHRKEVDNQIGNNAPALQAATPKPQPPTPSSSEGLALTSKAGSKFLGRGGKSPRSPLRLPVGKVADASRAVQAGDKAVNAGGEQPASAPSTPGGASPPTARPATPARTREPVSCTPPRAAVAKQQMSPPAAPVPQEQWGGFVAPGTSQCSRPAEAAGTRLVPEGSGDGATPSAPPLEGQQKEGQQKEEAATACQARRGESSLKGTTQSVPAPRVTPGESRSPPLAGGNGPVLGLLAPPQQHQVQAGPLPTGSQTLGKAMAGEGATGVRAEEAGPPSQGVEPHMLQREYWNAETAPSNVAGPCFKDVAQWAAYAQELRKTCLEYQAQCQNLRHQVEERKEWAQSKVRQVVGKLQKDNAELKRLRAEVEAAGRERAEHAAREAALEGRLNDSHETMRKAKADVDKMSGRLKVVEKEIAVLRSELEASRLKEAETAAQAAEVAKRERKVVKRGAVWEKARAKLQEDLAAERQRSAGLQAELARTRERLQQTEVLWRQEEKARDEAVEVGEREKRLRDAAEREAKRKEAAARQRSETESARHREEVQRLEAEIRRLKVAADHSTTLAAAARWGGSSPGGNGLPTGGAALTLQAAMEMASLRESNGRLRHEVGLLQERVRRDRECVMCMSEEQAVVFLPCAHQVLCQQCNDVHEKNGMTDCPSCRTPISQRVRVFGR